MLLQYGLYYVNPGDSYDRISKAIFGDTSYAHKIKELEGNKLIPGKRIFIPDISGYEVSYTKGDGPYQMIKRVLHKAPLESIQDFYVWNGWYGRNFLPGDPVFIRKR